MEHYIILFQQWIESLGLFGPVVYVLAVMGQVIIAIIPGGPFQIVGGGAFGTVLGTALCILGCVMGSMCVFLLVRRFGYSLLNRMFSEEKLADVQFILKSKRSKLLMLICFLLPGAPKDIMTYIAGLMDFKPWQWFLICFLGRLPTIILSAVVGSQMTQMNFGLTAAAFLLLLALSAGGALLYKRIKEKTELEEQKTDTP